MGVNSANNIIRQARLKAKLTQAQMSEGICSEKVLSRIENNMTNVSHATFEALINRAGVSCSIIPVFSSREDFDCFYTLKQVHFHLDAWKLNPAYEGLKKLTEQNWAGNRLYFQEWLLLYCRLQFRSYCCSHRQNYNTLLYALHITRPGIDLSDFRRLLLSQNELQILTALAHEALYLGDTETCRQIYEQTAEYLEDSKMALMEKEHLQAENAIVHIKYLISIKQYEAALKAAETYRHKIVLNKDRAPLFELTFLTGLCCHLTTKKTLAEKWIKAAFYSAHAVDSCYATACREYLIKETDFVITGEMASRPDIPLQEYPIEKFPDSYSLSQCFNDAAVTGSYSLGSLIRDLRIEQEISQDHLCRGLCSKSKLSKIENGNLMPDIMLAEAFLQRLGMPERIFTFWGNTKDKNFNDLKHKALYIHNVPKEVLYAYFDEMEQLLEEKDILYRQEYLFLKTLNLEPPGKRVAGFLAALRITMEPADITQICSWRLTWCELSILNNLAMEYCLTDQVDSCFTYVSQIEAYIEKVQPDLWFQNSILSHTYVIHCRTLYRQKLFQQVLDFARKANLSLMKYNFSAYGSFLFFYSQALGECSFLDTAETKAINACSLDEIFEYHKNPAALKKYLLEDFKLTINY